MAIVLGCNRKTVIRKFLFMAGLARQEHERRLHSGELKTSYIQMDEMLTFEHTKLKPISIALAVRAKTGEILEAQASQMNYLGLPAPVALNKYGPRENLSHIAVEDCLLSIKKCSKNHLTIETDKKKSYSGQIKKHLPHSTHVPMKGRRPFYEGNKDPNKPLFTLNYTCAKIRNDLSRMARKTWVTTKALWALQAHLDLYIAFNNGYKLVA